MELSCFLNSGLNLQKEWENWVQNELPVIGKEMDEAVIQVQSIINNGNNYTNINKSE